MLVYCMNKKKILIFTCLRFIYLVFEIIRSDKIIKNSYQLLESPFSSLVYCNPVDIRRDVGVWLLKVSDHHQILSTIFFLGR